MKADAVVQQVIALGFVGKMPAGDQLAAGQWAPLLGEQFLQLAVLVWIVGLAAEGGAEVIGSARSIGDEVLSPAVDVMAPGIVEWIVDEDVELSRARLEAKDSRVVYSAWAIGVSICENRNIPSCQCRAPPGSQVKAWAA